MDDKIKLDISRVLQVAAWVEGEIERNLPGLAAAAQAVGAKRKEGLLGFLTFPLIRRVPQPLNKPPSTLKAILKTWWL